MTEPSAKNSKATPKIEFYYSILEMGRIVGRSASTARQWPKLLPVPDSINVAKKDVLGWKLSTWRKFAETRNSDELRQDLLEGIAKLEKEEQEKLELYRDQWPALKPITGVRKPKTSEEDA